MAQKNIYEYDAKKLIANELPKYFPDFNYHNKLVVIDCETDLDKAITAFQKVGEMLDVIS